MKEMCAESATTMSIVLNGTVLRKVIIAWKGPVAKCQSRFLRADEVQLDPKQRV
jgi:hypothetical protein